MGVSTGVAHPAVKDSESRPITAGGFVDGAPIIFVDITKQAGIDKFHHRSGTPEKKTIIDAPGSGVSLIDYDNDGWLDIYLLNGSTVGAETEREPAPGAMLFHNNHDGTCTDVTARAGVANERWGFGVAVADYDNDGWPDIYVANYGKNRLYLHRLTPKGEELWTAMAGLLDTATFDSDRMRAAADAPASVAADLAEDLVRSGMPFREAHALVGRLVRESVERGIPLDELIMTEPKLGPDALAALEPGASVRRRTSPGGGGTASVAAQLEAARARLADQEGRLGKGG